ncbi:MAG: TetR/AcrR family transcriptional regulator [Pseudomonadota bacterium]
MSQAAVTRTLTPGQQDRRKRILTAARTLVASHGYDGMIMRDVATRAKVSPTTLYNLYNTKDELLLAALQESVADGDSRTDKDTSDPGYARLVAHLHHSVAQTREEPAYAKAINQALLRANDGDPLVEVLVVGTSRAIQESLEAMAELGQLHKKTDIKALAHALVGAFWGNYMLWTMGQLHLDSLEHELKRSFLGLLLPVTTSSTKIAITRELNHLLLR